MKIRIIITQTFYPTQAGGQYRQPTNVQMINGPIAQQVVQTQQVFLNVQLINCNLIILLTLHFAFFLSTVGDKNLNFRIMNM